MSNTALDQAIRSLNQQILGSNASNGQAAASTQREVAATAKSAPSKPKVDISKFGPNPLNLGLDLGGDTLKITFAYDQDKTTHYGKIVSPSAVTQIAIPALALYDAAQKKWLFGEEIDCGACEDFITTVKIKGLIALLTMPEKPKIVPNPDGSPVSAAKKKKAQKEWEEKKAVWEINTKYYFEKYDFPKFYFPVRREALNNFGEMVAEKMTFTADGNTPCSVCEQFFAYVRKLIDKRKKDLEKKIGFSFSGYRISLVHPAKVGDEYLKELSRIIEKSFGVPPFKQLSTNKALALFALHRGAVKENESFLVFDMGEESISVAQATIINGQVALDGVDGHSAPKKIGGNDVDRAIVEYMEERIDGRETLGTPSDGEEGHIREDSIYAKQYLLMRDVKRAKAIFSKPMSKTSSFHRGVPITFSREVFVQRRLTQEEIASSIGTDNDTGIAHEILQYIIEEVDLPINHNVKKIFLSGGLIETYALLDFIKKGLAAAKCKVTVSTFDDGKSSGDGFSILSYEDSVFAPAVGGAIVALRDIEIKTVLSLSYGTWNSGGGDSQQREIGLTIFANRGEEIGPNGSTFLTKEPLWLTGCGVDGEEFFSTIVTQDEVLRRRGEPDCTWSFTRSNDLLIGEPFSAARRKAQRDFDLKRVSGGPKASIYFKHKGRFVALKHTSGASRELIPVYEGFFVDREGHASLMIKNARANQKGAKQATVTVVSYFSLEDRTSSGLAYEAPVSEIEVYMTGMDDIDTN